MCCHFFSPEFVGGDGGSGSGKVNLMSTSSTIIYNTVLDEELKTLIRRIIFKYYDTINHDNPNEIFLTRKIIVQDTTL